MRIRIINPITTQSFTRSLAAEASRIRRVCLGRNLSCFPELTGKSYYGSSFCLHPVPAAAQKPPPPLGGPVQQPSEGFPPAGAELAPAGVMAKALGQAVAGHGADMVAVTQQPVSIPIGQFEKVHNVAQTVARQARCAQGRVVEGDRQRRVTAPIGPQLVGGQVFQPSQRTQRSTVAFERPGPDFEALATERLAGFSSRGSNSAVDITSSGI